MKRILFVVHRSQLANQAMKSYEEIFDSSVKMGIVGSGKHEYNSDFVFAMVETLHRNQHLFKYKKDDFDCIILDEAHHSPANTYQKIMNYFTPKLFLGMTATPDKRDDHIEGRNVYELFNHQIALEIRLQKAMEEGLLCPFHYFGISDIAVIDDKIFKKKKISDRDFNLLTSEERVAAVQEYLDGKGGYKAIARKYNIGATTMKRMVCRAKTEGIESVAKASPYRHYTNEIKEAAVEDYLNGKGSLTEICIKYKISTDIVLRRWISWYNNGKRFKEHKRSERGLAMNKGRKTTQEERAEIVAFCIENNKNYTLTVEKYNISYQQIYSWVRKYEINGVEGLIDHRGKSKKQEDLTEADRLRMENKILQAKLKDQEMEIKLLKKLRELRGGGH